MYCVLGSRSWSVVGQGELCIATHMKKSGSYVNEEARSIGIIYEIPFYFLISYVSNILCFLLCLILSILSSDEFETPKNFIVLACLPLMLCVSV